jgi:membrane-bound metal-dependent hydrolase YbcI (DUF457 family)
MLGHGLLAFAAVAVVALARGWGDRRALGIAVVAGLFGALPDVDMLYAVWGVFGADLTNALAANEAFWDASDAAHRSATHSLVVAVPTAGAVALLVRRRSGALATVLAAGLLSAVVAAGYLASGPLDAAMLFAFGGGAVLLAFSVRRYTDLGWRPVAGAALIGLLAHPFGDLFTGGPPRLLYPLGAQVVETKVLVSADPTVHLLFTFALEVVAVWLAALVFLQLTDRPVRRYVDPLAGIGVAYGAFALFIPAPTLAVPSAFVFSILGVGVLFSASTLFVPGGSRQLVADGGFGRPIGRRLPKPSFPDAEAVIEALLTGTAAVTVAWVAYLVSYLIA